MLLEYLIYKLMKKANQEKLDREGPTEPPQFNTKITILFISALIIVLSIIFISIMP